MEDLSLVLTVILVICSFIYLLLNFRSSFKNGKHLSPGRRVMIVISHPDDEVMFFGPAILGLVKTCDVYLLCLSVGDFRGQGKIRKEELYSSCKILGIEEQNIILVSHSSLKDDPNVRWKEELVSDIVSRHVSSLSINTVITFDRHGVSSHKNHASLYYAMACLALEVLCLCPTYELAIQIGEVVDNMSQFYSELKIRYAVRGEMLDRKSKLKEHIIIGTPGKVLDWSSLKFNFFDVKKIRVFVLDEADVMIAIQGHQDQSIRIHKHLNPDCQMLLFSATYDQEVMDFAENIVSNPVVIKLRREEESLDNIKQYYVYCETIEAKYRSIRNIYGTITIGQAIIFCHTRKTANWLAQELKGDGHALSVLTGDQTPDERINVLDRYRQGLEKILITTNVLSRGIDIEQVTIVVNFDLPIDQSGQADCETYLHRIGRTGRFGKHGLAINLVDSPKSMAVMKDIEKHFGKDIVKLDADDTDEIERIEQ